MNIIFLNTARSELSEPLRQYVQAQLATTQIFCFQEAASGDRWAYEDLLVDYTPFHTEKISEEGHYGNSIYVHRSLAVTHHEPLFTTPEFLGVAHFISVNVNGAEYTICNVHGVPQPGHKLDTPERIEQSRTLLDRLADTPRAIIGGDFNLLPETQSVQMIESAGYKNLIRAYGVTSTRNIITYERYPDNIQYYADYVFTSPDITVSEFHVPTTVVSDHQPLELSIEV